MESIKVRLISHKSVRHYGGREITTTSHICDAVLVAMQMGGQPYIVELLEACAGFPKGHKIALRESDYNIKQL